VAAGSTPRLTGGIAASVVLHGALVTAFFLMRPAPLPPSPPVYRVQLFAAPPGARAVGVVTPNTPPVQQTPARAPVSKPVVPKPVETRPAPKARHTAPAPRQATPEPKEKSATTAKPAKTETPPAAAGGGETGGRGADVANINTSGVEFPYPGYINNIARQIMLQFHPGRSVHTNEVRFIIRRDGTVDPESIHLVTSSGNYSFDQQALAAIEAAANARVFGPLPPGFREDILPVTFRFSPSLLR
jgi:periplasmic protein TonB